MVFSSLRMALAAAVVLVAAPVSAQEIVFVLNNQSGVDLIEFYASPTSVDTWEDDILGADILEAGAQAEVTIEGDRGCDYDLKFVFADGDELTDTADLCDTGEYTLTTE
jgi:hypothetical protein